MLTFVPVSLGEGRAVTCERCHGGSPTPVYRDSAQIAGDIETAVRSGAAAPGPNIELTGPEPFGHPELPAIVGMAVRSGVSRLRLHTDASAFVVPANAAGSVAAGVRHVRFSVFGGTPGVHDVLVACPGALAETLEGVRSYVAAAATQEALVHVSALVPVCRHNVRDLPAVVATATGAGAAAVLLRVEDGGLDLRAAIEWVTAACDTGTVNGVRVEVEGVPPCLMPDHVLHLADVVRARAGAKAPACAECALDCVCGGGPAGAAADTLAALRAPADAGALAGRMRVARGMAPS